MRILASESWDQKNGGGHFSADLFLTFPFNIILLPADLGTNKLYLRYHKSELVVKPPILLPIMITGL